MLVVTLLAMVATTAADYGDPRKGSCATGDSASTFARPAHRPRLPHRSPSRACRRSAGQVPVRRLHVHAEVHGRQVPGRPRRRHRDPDLRVLLHWQAAA